MQASLACYGFAYFAPLDTRRVPALVVLAIVLWLVPHDMMYGSQAALIAVSHFPGRLRYSGASLGYQLSSLIAGGPAPAHRGRANGSRYHSPYAIAAYIALCAIITLAATALMTDYTGKDISGEYDNRGSQET